MRLAGTTLALSSLLLLLAACGGGPEDDAPAVDAPYSNNFDGESALSGWIFYNPADSDTAPAPDVATLWAVDSTAADVTGGAAFSGSFSLNYNNGTNYAGANVGVAISPKINVAGMTAPVLFFRCNFDTETTGTSYDKRTVAIGYLDGGEPTYYYQATLFHDEASNAVENCAAMGQWHFHVIPFNPNWEVQKLRVAFQFDTVDGYANNYKGWFVDDFNVVEASALSDLINPTTGGGTDDGGTAGGGGTDGGTTGGGTTGGTTLLSADFEGSVTGWTFSGTDEQVKWAVDNNPNSAAFSIAASGTKSLNYNNGTDYKTGTTANSGSAKSPSISLADYVSGTLTFKCNYKTESSSSYATANYDVRRVRIYSAGATEPLVDEKLSTNNNTNNPSPLGTCAEMGQWHSHSLALNGTWGSIQIEFFFDTVDGTLNGYPGWAVDDVTVTADGSTAGGGGTDGGTTGGGGTDGGGTDGGTTGGGGGTDGGTTGGGGTDGGTTGGGTTGGATGTPFVEYNFGDSATQSQWTLSSTDTNVKWAFDVDLALLDSTVAAGTVSLNYNKNDSGTLTYNSGTVANSGTATSPVVDLTDKVNPKLVFKCWYKTEADASVINYNADRREVEIWDASGQNKLWSGKLLGSFEGLSDTAGYAVDLGPCGETGVGHTHTLPLKAEWGTSLRVVFSFNTGDDELNDYAGWFVNEVKFTSDSATTDGGEVKGTSESAGGSGDSGSDDSSCGGSVVRSISFPLWPLALLGLLLVAGGVRFRRVLG